MATRKNAGTSSRRAKTTATATAETPSPAEIREGAVGILNGYQALYAEFYKNVGLTVKAHFDRGFQYIGNVLSDQSSPTDWIKDGLALWIQSYGVGRSLCDATHKIVLQPTDQE